MASVKGLLQRTQAKLCTSLVNLTLLSVYFTVPLRCFARYLAKIVCKEEQIKDFSTKQPYVEANHRRRMETCKGIRAKRVPIPANVGPTPSSREMNNVTNRSSVGA